jgi:type IV fimbrial biogenesis protein FimT
MLVRRSLPRRRAHGFTLIELVTAIVVMALLATLALPSFTQFVANQRVRNASFDLMAALSLARSEAVTQGKPASLQKTSTTWDQGWTVIDGAGNTIQNQQAYKGLAITDSAGLGVVSYGTDGRPAKNVNFGGTKFTIKPSTAISSVTWRCISIGLSGVLSSTVGACS